MIWPLCAAAAPLSGYCVARTTFARTSSTAASGLIAVANKEVSE